MMIRSVGQQRTIAFGNGSTNAAKAGEGLLKKGAGEVVPKAVAAVDSVVLHTQPVKDVPALTADTAVSRVNASSEGSSGRVGGKKNKTCSSDVFIC